mgnify:CR=1 FL=1
MNAHTVQIHTQEEYERHINEILEIHRTIFNDAGVSMTGVLKSTMISAKRRGIKLSQPFIEHTFTNLFKTFREPEDDHVTLTVLEILLRDANTANANRALSQCLFALQYWSSPSLQRPDFLNAVIRMLIKAGATANARLALLTHVGEYRHFGYTHTVTHTSLHVAGKYGDEKTIRMLIRSGGRPNARITVRGANDLMKQASGEGRTPLHEATGALNVSTTRELIKHGAHVNATDARGWTPLHHVLRGLHHGLQMQATGKSQNNDIVAAKQIVKLLLGAGANQNMKVFNVQRRGHVDAVQLFDTVLNPANKRLNAIRNELTKPRRIEARRQLNALPNNLIQTILHRANLSTVDEFSPNMPNQITSNAKRTQRRRKAPVQTGTATTPKRRRITRSFETRRTRRR